MRIVNLQVEKDIDQGKPIKLDLGSGKSGRRGFYAVDHLELDGVDIVADLNEPLDLLPDNSVEYVFSQHALEHVPRLLPLLREIFRITKRNGFIEVVVPHFSNPYCYSDPTHIRFFGLYSMYYFVDESKQPAIRKVPSFYSDVRFDIESIRIEFYQLSMIDKLIVPFLSRLVNRNIRWQNFYERRLSSLFHSWQLRFLMRPEK